MSTSLIQMQSTIGGMAAEGGKVYTLIGALDVPSGVLAVLKAVEVKPGNPEARYRGCAAVSNNTESQARDVLFTDSDIRDAIQDYFDFSGRGLLRVEPEVARFDPASNIEADGIDDHGRKYRLGIGMTNGQLAVIAMCWHARRQRQVAGQMASFEEFAEDFGITSIGMGESGIRIGSDGWPIE